jgi:hypothetical protein
MSSSLVPSSGQLPIPFTGPKWLKRFNQFVDDLDELVEYYNELQETRRETRRAGGAIPKVEDVREERERQKKLIDDCRAGMRLYNRNGEDDPRYDDEGDLKIEYATARLCWMLDRGWPDHTKRFERHENPEQAAAQWCETLVEFVIARDTTAVELESVIVRLIDSGKPFPPQIQDVMPVLKAEQEAWQPRKGAIVNVQMIYQWLIEEIPEAKAKAEKRKAEEEAAAARRKAEAEKWAERRRLEAQIDAACKQVEAQEQLWERVEQIEREHRYIGQRYARRHGTLQAALEFARPQFPVNIVSCAIGLFDERRKCRAWEREAMEAAEAIEAEAPALPPKRRRPPSKRSRRVEPNPTKLAAARTEQITGEQTNGSALAACARPAAKRTQKPKGGKLKPDA